MNHQITFNQLKSLVLQQGIASEAFVWPYADFRQHLHYRPGDMRELARLIDRQFQIKLTEQQVEEITTLRKTVGLLNRIKKLNQQPGKTA